MTFGQYAQTAPARRPPAQAAASPPQQTTASGHTALAIAATPRTPAAAAVEGGWRTQAGRGRSVRSMPDRCTRFSADGAPTQPHRSARQRRSNALEAGAKRRYFGAESISHPAKWAAIATRQNVAAQGCPCKRVDLLLLAAALGQTDGLLLKQPGKENFCARPPLEEPPAGTWVADPRARAGRLRARFPR